MILKTISQCSFLTEQKTTEVLLKGRKKITRLEMQSVNIKVMQEDRMLMVAEISSAWSPIFD